MNKRRFFLIIFSIFLLIVLIIFYLKPFIIFLAYFIVIAYTLWGIYHIALIIIGSRQPFEPKKQLLYYPKISLIIPAKNEIILSRTIETILHDVNYPLGKKEIIVVTEDSLCERIALWYQQKYPENVKLLKRRQYFPTKPSALNDAFKFATGDIVGIVDVEDIIERDGFIKIASAMTEHKIGIVQTILRISNENDSWITRIFSMEYAGWFRLFLNGRSKLGLYTPLGGTGNYFRRDLVKYVGGWDSTNLTEDAEITVRFTLAKERVVVLNLRQWEEAPVKFKAWLRQRTRWFRGWMQTLWAYSKLLFKPWAIKRIGFINILSIMLMLIAPFLVILNWVAYSLTILWSLEFFKILHTNVMSDTFPFFAILPLLFNVIYYFAWIYGAKLEKVGKKNYLYIPHMIFYMNIMMPLASLRALYQEIFKPISWEKTEHPGRGVRWITVEKTT